MVNIKNKFRIYLRVVKRKTVGIPYGETWQGKDNEFYELLHEHGNLKNQEFISYITEKKEEIQTVLEVGCGTGIYPIKHKNLFQSIKYTGIDISKSAINFCKKKSNFSFLAGDFLKMEINEKFDLVFSHGVVNHVPDIDLFLSKIIKVCKKFAHIQATHGYFPNLEKHEMVWAKNQAIYNSNLSVKQIRKTLLDLGLNEKQFSIKPLESKETEISTIIEIDKTK